MDAIEGTAKARMLEILDDQPDDSSFDQLLRELAYRGMIERGLADSKAGNTISTDQLRSKLDQWQAGNNNRNCFLTS
jgi:hypothetical protein